MGQLLVMEGAEPDTLNTSGDDGFWCLLCNHGICYTNETEWGEHDLLGPHYVHMHGTEPFRFCPNCGRRVLTPQEWVEKYPEDVGKTFAEIGRRFF